MKKTLTIAMTLAVAAFAAISIRASMRPFRIFPSSEDEHGHYYSSLWQEYYEAHRKDRPQVMKDALEKIKKVSREERRPWDFWDAARKYADVRASINWKDRSAAKADLKKEIEEFDEPVTNFELARTGGSAAAFDYAVKDEGRLRSSSNPAFWKENSSVASQMGGTLPKYIRNDYEYALWALGRFERTVEKDGVKTVTRTRDLLSKEVSGRYPEGGWLEYLCAKDVKVEDSSNPVERKAALEKVYESYMGKAIGFYPRRDLLDMKKDSLDRVEGTSKDYENLYEELKAFERERKALSGAEGEIASGCSAQGLLDNLNDKALRVSSTSSKATVWFRNLPSAKLTIYSGSKKCHSFTVTNPVRSFYRMDKVEVDLPPLDDGEYQVKVENGDVEAADYVSRFTLSLAQRTSSDGLGVYVTDFESGEPLSEAELVLAKNGNELTRTHISLGEGFTTVPASFSGKMQKDKWHQMYACTRRSDGTLRRSPDLGFEYDSNLGNPVPKVHNYTLLYTDRGAYQPGDTVYFKGILYSGNLIDNASCAGLGKGVSVKLIDTEGKELENRTFTTNEFGSINGEFAIPSEIRGGMFHLCLESEGYDESTRYVRVDQYVLPTFSVSLSPIDKLYLPGDEVEIDGKVDTYSGHGFSGGKVSYRVSKGGTEIESGTLSPDADGSFTVRFRTIPGESQYYNVQITVVDGTGETQEADRGLFVSTRIRTDISLENTDDARVNIPFDKKKDEDGVSSPARRMSSIVRRRTSDYVQVVKGDTAVFTISCLNNDGKAVPVDVSYRISDEKDTQMEAGTVPSGAKKEVSLGSYPDGLYMVEASCSVPYGSETLSDTAYLRFLKVSPDSRNLPTKAKSFFRCGETTLETGDGIMMQFGASDDAPIWAVVELYGDNSTILERKAVHLDCRNGGDSCLEILSYPYLASYPDAVSLRVFYFKDSSSEEYERTFRRRRHNLDLPLEFSSFEDKVNPSSTYTFRLRTESNAEVLAAIFDKSTERIMGNPWRKVTMHDFNIADVPIRSAAGHVDQRHVAMYSSANGPLLGGARNARIMMAKSTASLDSDDMMVEEAAMDAAAPMASMAVEDEAITEGEGADASIDVREDFSSTIAFLPTLRSDSEGNVDIEFTTSDKLSTYIVSLYAHTKGMKNATLRREMVVSIPAKVAVVEPRVLYCGDTFNLSATVSNSEQRPLSGKLTVYQYDGKDYRNSSPVKVVSRNVTVPAGGSIAEEIPVDVPSKAGDMGLKVVFGGEEGFSDALFVSVPVREAVQTVKEAHSAVVLAGSDKQALLDDIRRCFVNVSADEAAYREISIEDMIREAIPKSVDPKAEDILSLTEAYYMRLVAGRLSEKVSFEMPTEKLVEKILAHRNSDGGFAWFEGMGSSPVLTAVILERNAKAGGKMDLTSSVKYLDKNQFDYERPYWCGGLSTAQYLLVRSLYSSVPFSVKQWGVPSVFDKRMKEFKKYVNEYLVPQKERGLNGKIFAKARRLRTLDNLLRYEGGVELARNWGITLSSQKKLKESLDDDVASLLEYAVAHRDGGMYYPNAVMPFRGLLESEAYAHSLLCDLMGTYSSEHQSANGESAGKIADGIRVWLMLQKETQQWDAEPAFVDAIASVLSGGEDVLSTHVILMEATYQKPFREIREAGNGFTISRKFYREVTGEDSKIKTEEIVPGTILHKGDRIRIEYSVWNQENRSFVRLRAPREAALMPVNQLSGHYGWGFRPISVRGMFNVQPFGYRDVRSDHTDFYFDTYPEENTSVVEEFHVTQDGVFSAPVVEIESLYAPHYRANGSYWGELNVN